MSMNKEKMCDTCKRGGESSIAIFWCKHCEEALCDTCMVFHKRIKSTSTHKVSKLSELSPQTKFDDSCLKHPRKRLKYFCLSHKRICCDDCIYRYHNGCSNICTIDEVKDIDSNKAKSLQLLKVLQEIDSYSDQLVNAKDQDSDFLDGRYQHILETVSTLITDAKAKMEGFQEDIETTLKHVQDQQTTKVLKQSKSLEKFADTVRNYQNYIQSTASQDLKARKQLLITTQKMKSHLKSEISRTMSDVNSDAINDLDLHIDYTMDTLDKTLKDSNEVKLLSTPRKDNCAQIMESISSLSSLQQTNLDQNHEPIIVDMLDNIETVNGHARKISEIRINGSRFYRGIFLNDNRILIPDYVYEKMKIYDVTGNKKFDYPLLRKPWDVACNTSGRIFVSFPNSMCFKKYTLSGCNFTERQTLDTFDSGVHGLDDVLGDHILYASEYEVNILQPNARPLRSISVSSEIPFIVASLTESKFYYTDGDNIICQNLEGTELQRFSNLDLTSTIALSMDALGGLYVSNYYDEMLTILKISDSGKSTLVAKVVCNDESPPRSVTFDTEGRRFMVVSHIDTPGNVTRTIRSGELIPLQPNMMEAGLAEIYQIQERNFSKIL